jgi:hypothetical protein
MIIVQVLREHPACFKAFISIMAPDAPCIKGEASCIGALLMLNMDKKIVITRDSDGAGAPMARVCDAERRRVMGVISGHM